MQSRIFPPELVDYTLDFLHNDSNTLINCSLVCRAFVPTCHIHIFRSVYIPSRASQRFHELLEDAPRFIPLVRNLQILNGGPFKRWISTEEPLSRFLTTIQSAGNLKALKIQLETDWIELPLDFRTSVRALLRLPSLTELDFINCTFESVSTLDALFSHCSGLKRVKLSGISIGDDVDTIAENFPHAQDSDRTRLECLTILGWDVCNIGNIINWVLHPRAALDVTRLRKLHSAVDPSKPRELSLFNKFLGILGSSLEHLHLQIGYGYDTSRCIYIDHLPLRSIRLSFDILLHFNPLTWLTNFFSQIKSSSIYEIVIDLRLVGTAHQNFLSLSWDDLDIALNRSTFCLLEAVDVTISWDYKETTGFVDDVKESLPRLASRRILAYLKPTSCLRFTIGRVQHSTLRPRLTSSSCPHSSNSPT